MPLSALDQAAKWLERRDFSGAELKAKLVDKGYSDEEVTEALAKALAYGWISDDRLADRQASRSVRMKHSQARARADLAKRGLPDEPADRIDDLSAARALLDAKRPADPAKAARMLGYRGFNEEAIRQVLEERYGDPADW